MEREQRVIGTGAWSHLGDLAVARLLATAGFDWIGLDGQHGGYHRETLLRVLAAASSDWCPLMVRVPSNDAAEIGFALDLGAAGVIVPMVDSAADARRAVTAALYPPEGTRSWGPMVRNWGGAPPEPQTANRHVEVWLMIETRGGLEEVESIAAVPGVTGLFVGPSDLSLSLGISVQNLTDDDSTRSPLARIHAAAEAAAVTPAAYGGTISARLQAVGYSTVALGSDVDFLAAGVQGAQSGERAAGANPYL